MIRTLIVILSFLFLTNIAFAQEENPVDSIEVFLIDSYVPPETPDTFVLSFFTSAPAKSSVIINDEYEVTVSEEYTDNHNKEIDLSSLDIEDEIVPFIIKLEGENGETNFSEEYEFDMPYEIKVEDESNFLLLCLLGGTVFAVPSPAYAFNEEEGYFSLTKEIPVISIRGGYTYPEAYFSIEYSHIFNAPVKNFFRVGYKHIIEIPGIEYVSPGVNGFTNFKGFNGISPEISLGLFRIFNTFTVYTRYRYNVKPGEAGSQFSEFTIGLYSSFLSIYL